jgi:zinc transporter ZupT
MALHSAAEGIGVGVAFAGGAELGVVTAVAIAIHNIPEGLAISLVAVPRGASLAKAAWLSVLSSLPQPMLAVPAFLLVETMDALLPWGFGVAGGAMVAMALGWLAPDALEEVPRTQFAVIAAAGLGAMLAAQALLL